MRLENKGTSAFTKKKKSQRSRHREERVNSQPTFQSQRGVGMEPGVYQISNEEYQAVPALSKGTIVKLDEKSPAHTKSKGETTPAMRFGTIVHHAVLEPDLFAQRYVVEPKCDKRTKAGKEAYHGFMGSLQPNQEVVTQEEMDVVIKMADQVHAHPKAKTLLTGGIAELSVFWKEPTYGFLCKCRPDYLITKAGKCIDYKSTVNASPKGFAKSIANFKYHFQVSWYLRGINQVISEKVDRFIFIAQEKTEPYAVACYECNAKDIEFAERKIEPLLELWANCEAFDDWPAYGDEIMELSLPGWAFY